MDKEEDKIIIEDFNKKKKKKKKRERTEIVLNEENEIEEEEKMVIEDEDKIKKKKKKKKEKLETKMEIVPEHPEKIAPLIGYFPSGFDPLKIRTTSEENDPQVRVFRKKDRPNRLQLVVSPKRSKIDFVGASHSGEAAASQICTYALGVLDKETQLLKIVPIASNKILRLEPRVGGPDIYAKELSKELKEVDQTAEHKADKKRDLTNLYGTKQQIRKDKKLASLTQKEDAKTQKDLDEKIEGVKINKEALESAGGDLCRNIPPHDSTATTPEQAYPVDRIILKGEWDYLLDVLELMQSGTYITTDAYPSFVCNRVHKLLEIEDEMEKKKLACIYSYITHLIKFKDQRSLDHASFAKDHRIPGILKKKFSTMFTDSAKHDSSTEKKNLLIGYILVLVLIADEYRTELSDIAKDLRMTVVSLRGHFESLGCKLKREADKLLWASLPVPLQFPKPKMQRRRR